MFALAVLVRLAVFVALLPDPAKFYAPDSRGYDVRALNLLERGVFSANTEPPYAPDVGRTPGYAAFMAAVYALAGNAPAAVALFDRVGRFDPALPHGNDTDWFLRAADHGALMEVLPDVLVYRRLHDANRSRHLAATSRQEYIRIVKMSLDRRRRRDGAPRPYLFPAPRRSD